MSGSATFSDNAYISMTAGNAAASSQGAYTIATLFSPSGSNGGLVNLKDATATERRAHFVDARHLFGSGDFSNGWDLFTTGNTTWYVAVQTKPAGSAHYRMHTWQYALDGSNNPTGTMSHGESVNAGNHGDNANPVTEIRIGQSIHQWDGRIAVVGIWNSALSDAQIDTLVSKNLLAWAALNPAELISLQNWNGTTGCNAVVGASAQSGLVGLVGVGANPPGFDFNLLSKGSAAFGMAVALAAAGGDPNAKPHADSEAGLDSLYRTGLRANYAVGLDAEYEVGIAWNPS